MSGSEIQECDGPERSLRSHANQLDFHTDGFASRKSVLPHVDAHDVSPRIATVDATIGQHRCSPAFTAQHLATGRWLESIGGSRRHDQLTRTAQRNELSIGDDNAPGAKARMAPLLSAGGELDALQ